MQDNIQENQSLDDDILRCKEDLRKAFDAIGDTAVENASDGPSVPKTQEAVIDAEFAEEEEEIILPEEILDVQASSEPASAVEPEEKTLTSAPIRILPFDAIQQNGTAKASSDETSDKSPALEPETLPADKGVKFEVPQADPEQIEAADKKLEDIVQQTHQEIDSITTQKKDLQKQLDSATSERARLQNELERLHQEFQQQQLILKEGNAALKEEVETLLSQREYAVQQLKDLKGQTEQQSSDRETLLADIQELEEELKGKNQALQEQQQQIQSANEKLQNLSELKETNSHLQKEIDGLKAEKPEFLGERQRFCEENQHLSIEIDKLQSRMKDLQFDSEQIGQLRKDLEGMDITLSHERARIRELEGFVKSLEDELTTAKHDQQDLSEKLESKEQELEQITSEHKRLHDEYDGFRNQENRAISDMTFQLDDHRDQLRNLRGDLEQVRHEYEAFQTQADGEIRLLTDQNNQSKNECETLSAEIGRLKEELQRAGEQTEHLHAVEIDLKNANESLDHERQREDELRQQCEQQQSSVSAIQTEKEELSNRCQSLQASKNELQEELAQLRETVRSSEGIRDELAAARKEVDCLKQKSQGLEKQISDMNQARHDVLEAAVAATDDQAPVTDETAIEQESDIPVFNLADQIMEEHRRSVASRRQRPETASPLPANKSIDNVIRQYVNPVGMEFTESDKRAVVENHPWTDSSLTPFQQHILQEIVQKDMDLYSQKDHLIPRYPSMKN